MLINFFFVSTKTFEVAIFGIGMVLIGGAIVVNAILICRQKQFVHFLNFCLPAHRVLESGKKRKKI